jgi:hypothetical protein
MIKSVNVVYLIDKNNPEGLNNIDKDQLKNVTNNYIEHIDCTELDKFPISDRHDVFIACVQKLGIKGTVTFKFVNLDLLANKIEKAELTGQQYSKLLPDINSCWSHLEAMDAISQSSLQLNNMYYDHIYTILKLEKTQ